MTYKHKFNLSLKTKKNKQKTKPEKLKQIVSCKCTNLCRTISSVGLIHICNISHRDFSLLDTCCRQINTVLDLMMELNEKKKRRKYNQAYSFKVKSIHGLKTGGKDYICLQMIFRNQP